MGLTCPTEVAKVRVTLAHSQEAGAMFGVAGPCATAASREPVWTVRVAVTVLLTEVGGENTATGTSIITRLARVETGLIVVAICCLSFQLGLDLAVVVGPRPAGWQRSVNGTTQKEREEDILQ